MRSRGHRDRRKGAPGSRARLNPDIVVLDIAMPHLNGLDAGRQLKSRMPHVKLIFMTQHQDPFLVGEAFRAGGSAFLLKEAAASELTQALDQVLKGGSYVTPSAERGWPTSPCATPEAAITFRSRLLGSGK